LHYFRLIALLQRVDDADTVSGVDPGEISGSVVDSILPNAAVSIVTVVGPDDAEESEDEIEIAAAIRGCCMVLQVTDQM